MSIGAWAPAASAGLFCGPGGRGRADHAALGELLGLIGEHGGAVAEVGIGEDEDHLVAIGLVALDKDVVGPDLDVGGVEDRGLALRGLGVGIGNNLSDVA